MLRKTIILFLFLGYALALNCAAIAEVDDRDLKDEKTSEIVYKDPVLSPIIEPPSAGIAEPMTFGAIALVIAIGGGILVRRNSN